MYSTFFKVNLKFMFLEKPDVKQSVTLQRRLCIINDYFIGQTIEQNYKNHKNHKKNVCLFKLKSFKKKL